MSRWIRAVGVLAVCVALAPSLSAQWPAYPTPGVPRLPDGKPNLNAPAPRTPEGKPDLSGVWGLGGGGGGGRGRGAAPDPALPQFSQGPPVSQFFEVAGRGTPLPIQPWA